jgi:UDP-glucose 4-epimerase
MKILIIGGAGFIGSHLCESYANDHIVTSLDNYISGKKDNHVHNVKYLDMDAKNILSLKEDYDLIFHLGEYSRVENSLQKIDFVLKNNLRPLLDILQFVKKTKAKLIYAGSSTKFADRGENKFKSPYAFSKWQNSELVKFYCEAYNIKYAITYFYNVYGGRENSNGEFATVIAKFLERKKFNKRLKITRPGTQVRNFTHIDDTIDALKLIAANGIGDDYGIANPKSYSINDVAHFISEDIEYTHENAANRLSSPIICEKTVNLGWAPKIELEEYIKSKV